MGVNNHGKLTGLSNPPTPIQRLYLILTWIAEHLAWLPTATSGALTIGASIAFAFVGDPPNVNIAAIIWGVALLLGALLLAVFTELWRHSSRKSLRKEVSSGRAFMVDALDPIAQQIARMPSLPRAQRDTQLVKIVANASASMPVALPEAENLRIIVYKVKIRSGGEQELEVFNHIGRKDKPGRIINREGTRGWHIFKAIREGRSVFEPDIDASTKEGIQREGKRYKTFISSPIIAHDSAYGMLSVDSPRVGSLDDNDVAVVEFMASMLAIAFAEAGRS